MWYNGCCQATVTTGDGVMESVLIREVLDKLPVPELEGSVAREWADESGGSSLGILQYEAVV